MPENAWPLRSLSLFVGLFGGCFVSDSGHRSNSTLMVFIGSTVHIVAEKFEAVLHCHVEAGNTVTQA